MKLFDKYLITSHHLRVYKSSKVLRVNRLNNARSTRWITYPLNNVNIAFTFHFFVCTGNIWQSTFRGRRVSSLFCCIIPPTPRKFLLMESGIWEIFPCGMENPALWNPEYSSRNPESHLRLESRIQVPLTKTGIQCVESGIHDEESRTQARMSWIPLYEASCTSPQTQLVKSKAKKLANCFLHFLLHISYLPTVKNWI